MVVWTGWGILVVLITVGLFIAADLLSRALFGRGAAQAAPWLQTLALLISAAAVWFVGRSLNNRPGRELIDPATNERVVIKGRHTFFFVPMQWWAIPLAVGGLVLLVQGMMAGPGR